MIAPYKKLLYERLIAEYKYNTKITSRDLSTIISFNCYHGRGTTDLKQFYYIMDLNVNKFFEEGVGLTNDQ